MNSTTKLTGREAIEYAKVNGLLLNKYEDPTEEARQDVEIWEAESIVREDPSLIWTGAASGRYEVRVIRDTDFGALLFASDDQSAAGARADELGTAHYNGVAIIDTANQMADMGDRIVPVAKAFAPEPIDPVICHGCRCTNPDCPIGCPDECARLGGHEENCGDGGAEA